MTYPDTSKVPIEYYELNSFSLKPVPLHFILIDLMTALLPAASPPGDRLFSMSALKREAMKKYNDKSLMSGLIHPSSSLAGAGFFFVKKKDGSLRSCIDYQGHNHATVKNWYPLPLMSSVFELLNEATVYSTLDLANC